MTDSRIKSLQTRIESLESRLREAAAIATRTIQLEHDLMLARAAITDLKHKLFLIASEEEIQAAIAQHSVGLFVKTQSPKIGIRKRSKRRVHK